MTTKSNALVYYGSRDPATPAHEIYRDLIEERAYFKAVQRDFAPGYELEDWLAAETEVYERFGRR